MSGSNRNSGHPGVRSAHTLSSHLSQSGKAVFAPLLTGPRIDGDQGAINDDQAKAERSEEAQVSYGCEQRNRADDQSQKQHRLLILQMGNERFNEIEIHAITSIGCVARSGFGAVTPGRTALNLFRAVIDCKAGAA